MRLLAPADQREHEAMLAAGATAGISHIKVAQVDKTIDSLTDGFR